MNEYIELAALCSAVLMALCVLVLFADRVLPRFLPKQFDPRIDGGGE